MSESHSQHPDFWSGCRPSPSWEGRDSQTCASQSWHCPSKQAQWLCHLFSRKAEAGSITQRIGSASLGLVVVLTISSNIKLVHPWCAQLIVRLSVPPSFQFLPLWAVQKLAWMTSILKELSALSLVFSTVSSSAQDSLSPLLIPFLGQWSRKCLCCGRNRLRSKLDMVVAKSSKGVPPHCRVEYQITQSHMHSLHSWSFFTIPFPFQTATLLRLARTKRSCAFHRTGTQPSNSSALEAVRWERDAFHPLDVAGTCNATGEASCREFVSTTTSTWTCTI